MENGDKKKSKARERVKSQGKPFRAADLRAGDVVQSAGKKVRRSDRAGHPSKTHCTARGRRLLEDRPRQEVETVRT